MSNQVLERRQSRRVDLEVPIDVREIGAQGQRAEPITGRARNVSLAGCYALIPASAQRAVGTPVSCTITIPQELTQQFPFVRLVGKGWIVRVTPAKRATSDRPGAEEQAGVTGSSPEVGVAINFVYVTPLTTIGGY